MLVWPDFKKAHDREPSRIYVSAHDESDWEMAPGVSGDLLSDITVRGIRAAVLCFRGIPITWDAPETKVE